MNRLEESNRAFGTVGTLFPGDVEVKIDTSDGVYAEGEGEILVKAKRNDGGIIISPTN